MACEQYRDRLHELEDWLSGTLERPAREQVDRHLVECAACREELELARECATLLRNSLEPAAEPSGAFWFKVQAGIRRAGSVNDFWASLEWVARRLAWSAGLAVLLLGAYALENDFQFLSRATNGEVAEIFPEPTQQPSNDEEVLMTLAGGGR